MKRSDFIKALTMAPATLASLPKGKNEIYKINKLSDKYKKGCKNWLKVSKGDKSVLKMKVKDLTKNDMSAIYKGLCDEEIENYATFMAYKYKRRLLDSI